MRAAVGPRVLGVTILLAVVVVAAVLLLAEADRPGDARPAYDNAEARLAAVRAAASVGIDGSRFLATSHPPEIAGDQRASGERVTFVWILRRRLDLREVPMDDLRGGPVEALLDLARAQERALSRAAFEPMAAEWTTEGMEGRQRIESPDDLVPLLPMPPPPRRPPGTEVVLRRPRVEILVWRHSGSGQGGGPDRIDLNAPAIVHYRLYAVPGSGATLAVRNRYDQATRVVDSEFSYSDRTVEGADYPVVHYRVSEEIRRPD